MSEPISLAAVEKACFPAFLRLPWTQVSGPDDEVAGLVEVSADEDGVTLWYAEEGDDHAEFIRAASAALPAMVKALRGILTEAHTPVAVSHFAAPDQCQPECVACFADRILAAIRDAGIEVES